MLQPPTGVPPVVEIGEVAHDARGAARHCRAMLAKWQTDNPEQARCLDSRDRRKLYDLCYQTFGTRTLAPAAAFRQMTAVVTEACAERWRRRC